MLLKYTEFAGLIVIEPERNRDDRGHFERTFCAQEFQQAGLVTDFVQAGTAFNHKAGTVRGMHFQREPYGEIKLIRVTRGAIWDVVVDLRKEQPTYLKNFAIKLSAECGRSLYVPKQFAHGYQTLEDNTEVLYSFSTAYVAGMACGIRWDDPAINIHWPLPISMIATRDQQWPLLT